MNLIGFSFMAAWIIGITIFIYGLALCGIMNSYFRNFGRKEKKQNKILLTLYKNKSISSFKNFIEGRADFAGLQWNFATFTVFSAVTGSIGIVIALKYLLNPMAVLPLTAAFSLVPWLYLSYFIAKKEDLLERQFIPAIQYFIAEYNTLPNIVSVLCNIIPMIDYPLKDELNRLVLDFNSGRNPETALFLFARRINTRWAFRLAHIFNLRLQKGININSMLFSLYIDIKTKVVKERERKSETAAARAESIILYLCIPIIYFIATKVSPDSHYLLTQTSMGQKAMLVVVFMVLFGIITTAKLGNSRIK